MHYTMVFTCLVVDVRPVKLLGESKVTRMNGLVEPYRSWSSIRLRRGKKLGNSSSLTGHTNAMCSQARIIDDGTRFP